MNFKINKKIVISIIVVLILTTGGVFLWLENRETPPEKWDTAKMSEKGDYNIEKDAEGKTIVKNKKAGLSFEVPEGWIVEEVPSFVPEITFHSPDTEINNEKRTIYLDVLEKGCRINVSVAYIKTNLETLKKEIEKEFFNVILTRKIDKYKEIKISGHKTIEHSFSADNLEMYYITNHLPFKNRLYIITLSVFDRDKELCEIEFNKFLETISIG